MAGTIPSYPSARNSPWIAQIAESPGRISRAERDCLEGRGERQATGMGSPEPTASREGTQVDNLCYERPRANGELGRYTG